MKKRNISLIVGVALTGIVLSVALIALFWTPYDPDVMDTANRFQGISKAHIFGTDHFGRDIFARLMKASSFALFSGLLSVSLAAILGIALGIGAALSPIALSFVLLRIIDALMAFPMILTALMLSAVLGKGLIPSITAICFCMIPGFARLTYTMILEERSRLYIKAARSYGASNYRIVIFHLLPPLGSRLVTHFTSAIGSAVLIESSLSFLGLGIQPPAASLGTMLSEARSYILTYPYQIVPPGIMLLILVLGFNLLGDGVNQISSRKRRTDG